MGVLVVSAAGAAIGGSFGYAAMGWTIGSIIGNMLFPAGGQDTVVEGPRLGDLSVTSAAYGKPIALLYGDPRVGGEMIWSEDIEEVKTLHESESEGKGGDGPTQTNIVRTYFWTGAISFGHREMDDVLRMWGDGKLFYDKTGTTTDDIIKVGVDFRFYGGSETQEPDSIIEAAEGVGSTPAFRGQCYIVFDKLPLADFANHIPNITVELTEDFTAAQPVEDIDWYTSAEGGLAGAEDVDLLYPDYDRGVFYARRARVLRRINTRTMTEERQIQYDTDFLGNSISGFDIWGVMPNGYIVANATSSNTRPVSLIDPNSLKIIDTFGVAGVGLDNDPDSCVAFRHVGWIETASEVYVFHASIKDSIGVLRASADGLQYIWDSDAGPGAPEIATNFRLVGLCNGIKGDTFGDGYVMGGPNYGSGPKSDTVNIYRVRVDDSAFYDSATTAYIGVDFSVIAELAPGDLVPGESQLSEALGMIYDPADDTIMFQVRGASDGQHYMIKYDANTASVVWRSEIPSDRNSTIAWNHSRVGDGTYGQINSGSAWALRTATGEVFYTDTWATTANTAGAQWWDSRSGVVVGAGLVDPKCHKWFFFRGTGAGIPLSAIIRDLCLRTGLEAADIDVTELAPTVPAFTIGRQSTAGAGVRALMPIYFYDGVESDWILKFPLRDGKSSVATITQDELAPSDESGEFFLETRVQEVELPMRYSITYMNKNDDHQQATQSAKRVLGPTPAMNSRNELNIQVAASLAPSTVKRAAEEGLYSSWVERVSHATQLSWEYIPLDPSDIVTFNLDDGSSYRERLVQTDMGANLVLDVNSLSEDAAQYTSDVDADGGTSGPVYSFLTVASTQLIVLCSPLLRDRDDVGRTVSQVYYLMGGYGQPGWPAGILYKSADGTEYSNVGTTISEMAWGAAGNALGSTSTPFQTDEINTLTVHMTVGAAELSSVTQLQMLNGSNAAALIHANGDVEVLQFRDVTVNADGSLTLSGLLRGRRGTEISVSGHAVGDIFVLLTSADASLLSLSLGEVDATRYYKGVTSGQRFEDAPILSKASPGNDLKPYAVVHQTATLGGSDEIDLDWVRQTRVGGEWKDGTGGVPVSEDSEEYEVDILDGPGGSVVRTVPSLSSSDYSYSSANQVTDGFSPPLTSITVEIIQISAQVGRGFSTEVTLDVG